MCCKSFWKGVAPFALAFVFGLLATNTLRKENSVNTSQENLKSLNKIIYSNKGVGSSSVCSGKRFDKDFSEKPSTTSHSEIKSVQITSKPRAGYTDIARQNQIQGTVTLRVTFTASGSIGSIFPVSGLPYGLTEQAIAAARGIKFEPAKKNGVPQTVTKQVQYSFTIY